MARRARPDLREERGTAVSASGVNTGADFWGNKDFASGEFITWEEGTELIGEVTGLSTHTFPENERGPARTVPMVLVKDQSGHVSEVTCGPADLKKKMVAAAPCVGDRIKIECVGSNKTALGIQRFFKVQVQRAPHLKSVEDGNKIAAAAAKRHEPVEDTEVPF